MFIETGFIVFLSLMVIVWGLPLRTVLWLLGHPLFLEVPFSLLAYGLHFGTYSGMMVAAVAAVMCFVFVRCTRWLIGYTKNGVYRQGLFNLRGALR